MGHFNPWRSENEGRGKWAHLVQIQSFDSFQIQIINLERPFHPFSPQSTFTIAQPQFAALLRPKVAAEAVMQGGWHSKRIHWIENAHHCQVKQQNKRIN